MTVAVFGMLALSPELMWSSVWLIGKSHGCFTDLLVFAIHSPGLLAQALAIKSTLVRRIYADCPKLSLTEGRP